MANKKISELNELTAAGGNDLVPVVDVLTTETKKIKVANLLSSLVVDKTSIGLGNVDNTSDINKPISSATQSALNAKENLTNKSTSTALGTSDTLYPTQNAVKSYVDTTVASVQVPLVKNITGTQSTTSNSASNILGANFSVAANETWSFEFNIQIGCSGVGGVRFALTFPGAANLRSVLVGTSTGSTSQDSEVISTSGTLTTVAFNSVNSQDGFLRVTGTIFNGAASGTVQLQYASQTGGQTSTVYAHSTITASKIA
jgi:hypothetical protein